MAQAIAQGLLETRPHGATQSAATGTWTVLVRSAGVGAGEGAPAAPEAIRSVARLDPHWTGPLREHASHGLSKGDIREADVIYTMTRAHAESVIAMDPKAAGKVHMLDPAGKDLPDPIGRGPEVYDATARKLLELIRTRLTELKL